MIEDPLYLPKDTPVYMIGNTTNVVQYEMARECKKQWETYGYNVTQVPYLANTDYDFFDAVSHLVYQIPIEYSDYRRQALAIIAIWKKQRRRGKSCLIVGYDSYLVRDIPLIKKDSEFLYLTNYRKLVDVNKVTAANLTKSYNINSFYLSPKTCHILYNDVCNASEDLKFHNIYIWILQQAVKHRWIVMNNKVEQPYVIPYTL